MGHLLKVFGKKDNINQQNISSNIQSQEDLNKQKSLQKKQGQQEKTPTISSGQGEIIQRDVGFEFEDLSWTVMSLQSGRSSLRNPNNFFKTRRRTSPLTDQKTDEEEAAESHGTGTNLYKMNSTDERQQLSELSTNPDKQPQHVNFQAGNFGLETAQKKMVIHQGTNFDIETDGPYSDNGLTNRMDMEIVTKPFPENQRGLKAFQKTKEEILEIYQRIRQFSSGFPISGDLLKFTYNNFIGPKQHGLSNKRAYLYGGAKNWIKMQATSGVSLEDLPQMMDQLGHNPEDFNVNEDEYQRKDDTLKMLQELMMTGFFEKSTSSKRQRYRAVLSNQRKELQVMKKMPQLAQQVISNLVQLNVINNDTDGIGQLKGFLSQALLYMVMLGQGALTYQGIKVLVPFLSRYSFDVLYKQIPETLREQLQEQNHNFLQAVSSALEGNGSGNLSSPMLNFTQNSKKWWSQGDTEGKSKMKQLLGSISRREWLTKVMNGKDLLKPEHLIDDWQESENDDKENFVKDYGPSLAVFLRGHGNTTNVQDKNPNQSSQLAISENRAINPGGTQISIEEALNYASYYFDWISGINGSKRDKLADKKFERQRQIELNSLYEQQDNLRKLEQTLNKSTAARGRKRRMMLRKIRLEQVKLAKKIHMNQYSV